MHPNALLDLATELLRSVLKFDAPADGLVSVFFRKHNKLGARERHTLAARVLATEHVIYPRSVRWFVEGRLALEGGVVRQRGGEPQLLLAAG